MQFRGRAILTLAAVVVLNLGVRGTCGFYSHAAFGMTMLALILGLAACLLPERVRVWRGAISGDTVADGDTFLLACAVLLLGSVNINSTETSYADVTWARRLLGLLALGGYLIVLLALFGQRGVFTDPIDHADLKRHRALFIGALTLVMLLQLTPHLVDVVAGSPAFEEHFRSRSQFTWTAIDSLTFLAAVALTLGGGLLFLRRGTLFSPASASENRRMWTRLFALTLVFGVALRGGVLYASPDPVIDVFALLRDVPDHMLAGRNPYIPPNDIVTPYGTARAHESGVFDEPDPRPAGYPPHPYLLALPFRVFQADPRWANVVGDGLAAVALFGIALRRNRPLVGFLAAALWLFTPRTTFMMEQAWYEPMIGGLIGVGLWLAEIAGWQRWLGYILVGLALTAKQYGAAILPALAWPHRNHWKQIVVGLAVSGLVMLPWLVWSPHEFMDTILWKHLARPSQHARAITVAGGCHYLLGFIPPREAMWAVAGSLILLVSVRAPRNGAATAIALGTALLVFCVFHTQGFFNYFYLVQYLWLVGFVGLMPATTPMKAANPAQPCAPPDGR